MNPQHSPLLALLLVIGLFALMFANPKVAFAGADVGWTPQITMFTEGAGESDDTKENPEAAEQAEKQDEQEDIQTHAKRVADEDYDRSQRGESAPNIDANPANLAKFHQRENLPEHEKEGFQTIKPQADQQKAEKAEDAQRTEEENQQREEDRKAQKFGAVESEGGGED